MDKASGLGILALHDIHNSSTTGFWARGSRDNVYTLSEGSDRNTRADPPISLTFCGKKLVFCWKSFFAIAALAWFPSSNFNITSQFAPMALIRLILSVFANATIVSGIFAPSRSRFLIDH